IFAAGIGNPYFSTDTTAALRAAVVEADVILMGKNSVDGACSADPKFDSGAYTYDTWTSMEMLQENLQVTDATASSFCMANDTPLVVFSITEDGNIKRAVSGETIGTFIKK